MLPLSSSSRRSTAGDTLSLYFRRVLKPKHMDWQYNAWTMLQLLLSPKTVYRQTSFHNQTKGSWARNDDPAFLILSIVAVATMTFIYGLM